MGKYHSTYTDIYLGIFGTPAWESEGINTFPDNFVGTPGVPYIRVSIVASGAATTNITKSVSGQILIEIFSAAGEATESASTIADTLDVYLSGKLFSLSSGRTTQLFSSTLAPVGQDTENPGLYRMLYTIPFNHFGVQ